MIEVRLLGPLEVLVDGRPVPLGGPKQRSVLAMLALEPNRVVSIDRLIDGVWGEAAADGARRTLQVYVSNLRSALAAAEGLRIETRSPGYVLEIVDDAIDRHRFEQAAAGGRHLLDEGRFAEAAARLDEAAALWRGAPLADVALQPFADAGGLERLEEARAALLEDRIDATLALGHHEEAVSAAEALVVEQPLRERPWGQLMLGLYRSGRQADALRAYGRARDALVEELGIEPGPALRELEGRILGQDPDLAAAAHPAAPAEARRLAAVPQPTSSLVGRTRELADVEGLLVRPDVRLVTLAGPGGVGKTRLAIAAAERVAARFPGGAAFVDVSSATDAGEVLPTVAGALGVPEGPADDDVAAIARQVGDQPLLLVLDNLEQVIDVAGSVAELLRAAPAVTALTTSRVPLRISGEHEVTLGPLDPTSSVEMFLARCRSRTPGYAGGPEDQAHVEAICSRLDGLPLAIELAAARSKVLRPHDLLDRLADCLGLLVGGDKDLPDRQRTLRATLEWSYDLLDEDRRRLLDRLAVFAGPFSLEGAEQVASSADLRITVLDGLGDLVDSSLVRPVDTGIALRFQLLPAVRDFALERLEARGELDERRDLHVRHVLEVAQAARVRLDGPQAAAATTELLAADADHRAALRHALDRDDHDAAAELAVALRPHWVRQGRLRENRTVVAELLDGRALGDRARARASVVAGALAYYQDELDSGIALLEDGVERARSLADEETLALGLCFLASSLVAAGQPARAEALAAEASALSRATGTYEPGVMAASVAAMVAGLRGDVALEVERHEERLALARDRGDRTRVADTLNTLAEIALDEGAIERARALAAEAVDLARTTSRLSTRDVLLTLARVELGGGHVAGARTALEEALELCAEVAQPFELAQCLRAVASLVVITGSPADGARMFGAAEAVQGGGQQVFPVEPDLAAHRDHAEQVLGPAAYGAATSAGRALDLEGALGAARDLLVRASASDRSTPS